MSKIKGKVELNFSFPNNPGFEGKTEKQKNKLAEKTIRSVMRFGNVAVEKVKIKLNK